jgi:hypothetical protein
VRLRHDTPLQGVDTGIVPWPVDGMPTHRRSLQSAAALRPSVGTVDARLAGAGRRNDEAADTKGGRVIRRLEQSEGRVIGYSISGDFDEDEYSQTISELRDDIAREGTIRVLFRLSDVSRRRGPGSSER